MKGLNKALVNYIIPLAVIIIGFIYNPFIGFLFLLGFIGYRIYAGRVGIMAFIGKSKYARGDIDGALSWYEKAYKTGKAGTKIAVSYAYLLLKFGRLEEAEKILDQLSGKNLEFDEKMIVKSNMALVLWKKGKLDEAVAMLEEVNKDYKTTMLYGSLGYLLILQGDLEKALSYNLEAYEYNSSNGVIADNLGQTYYLMGEYDKAEEIYEKLMPSNPSFPEAYYNYGLVLAAKNKHEKALETIKKALNYKTSSLSGVTREEIEAKIKELSEMLENKAQ